MEVTRDRIYAFTLTGYRPLLMHACVVLLQDELETWRKATENKSLKKAGDDRVPAWSWQTYLYHDGEHVMMPQDNIMAALKWAGSKILLKGNTTFKALTQSNLFIYEPFCEFLVGGRRVSIKDIHACRDMPFPEQLSRMRELGFSLDLRRAKVNGKMHVRVRPEFTGWEIKGMIEASDPALTDDVMTELFAIAGKYAGLGDWRPSSKEGPGPYGTFHAEVTLVSTTPKNTAGKKAG